MKRPRVLFLLLVSVLLAVPVTVLWSRVLGSHREVKSVAQVNDIRLRAERGDARAQAGLGSAFLFGQGVPQDDTQALHWYQESAEQGDAQGECGLGWMYSHGRAVSQDNLKAIQYYKAGADAGSALCQNGLAYFYAEGIGVTRDYNEAFRWYRVAAEKGYAKAEYNLGNMYLYGTGVARDQSEASRWFTKAANQGDPYARQAIGLKFTALRVFVLVLQVVSGTLLVSSSLTLNYRRPKRGLNDTRDWLPAVAGVLCLFTAALSWFGYKHSMIWYWINGVTGFSVVLWVLHSATLAALFLALFRKNSPASA